MQLHLAFHASPLIPSSLPCTSWTGFMLQRHTFPFLSSGGRSRLPGAVPSCEEREGSDWSGADQHLLPGLPRASPSSRQPRILPTWLAFLSSSHVLSCGVQRVRVRGHVLVWDIRLIQAV